MKTSPLLIGTAACLMAAATACGTLTPEQKAARQQEKQMKERLDSIAFVKAVKAIDDMDFVLEADRLTFKRGNSPYVSSATNFVSAVDGVTTVQVAPFNFGGPNGMGGFTVEGKASNIKKEYDKKGNYTMSMSVLGTNISATVNIKVVAGSNRASATVSPNFNSNTVTLSGKLVPAAESNVSKGFAR